MVKVEVVYVPVDQQTVHLRLEVMSGATVEEVLDQSGIFQRHPETKGLAVGIFGTQVSLATVVKAGERIEIYRALMIDPKEKRRQRARTGKKI